MSPITRNVLIVGGAAIAIALFLTCGPLLGTFGGKEQAPVELPAVAAGPPADVSDTLAAATDGAAAGAGAGEIGVGDVLAAGSLDENIVAAGAMDAAGDAFDDDAKGMAEGMAKDKTKDKAKEEDKLAGAGVVAAGGVAAGAIAAGASSGAGAGAAGAAPTVAASSAIAAPTPAVSAGPPSVPVTDLSRMTAPSALVAAGGALPGIGSSSRAAQSSFDQAYSAVSGVDAPEGKVVGRFAPPVAAIPSSSLALNQVRDRTLGVAARQPCDSPGAGCRTLLLPPANPPLRPGRPPSRRP